MHTKNENLVQQAQPGLRRPIQSQQLPSTNGESSTATGLGCALRCIPSSSIRLGQSDLSSPAMISPTHRFSESRISSSVTKAHIKVQQAAGNQGEW